MPLLEPNPDTLRPAAARPPSPDRVHDGRAQGTPEPLREELTALRSPAAGRPARRSSPRSAAPAPRARR